MNNTDRYVQIRDAVLKELNGTQAVVMVALDKTGVRWGSNLSDCDADDLERVEAFLKIALKNCRDMRKRMAKETA